MSVVISRYMMYEMRYEQIKNKDLKLNLTQCSHIKAELSLFTPATVVAESVEHAPARLFLVLP